MYEDKHIYKGNKIEKSIGQIQNCRNNGSFISVIRDFGRDYKKHIDKNNIPVLVCKSR